LGLGYNTLMLTAIVLAAGQSRRMGTPKINLPWGETTVLGKVLGTLLEAGMEEILLVTGAHPVQGLENFAARGVREVFNPDYALGEMLSSFQAGLRAVSPESTAVLLALGDQPQMEIEVVRAVMAAYQLQHPKLLIPSYQMHRGHPWVVSREFWNEILMLEPPATLRDFLRAHTEGVTYLALERDSVLQDLDTPQDYERYRP
jgi:molybdenum cofactor cytidylyltransferase